VATNPPTNVAVIGTGFLTFERGHLHLIDLARRTLIDRVAINSSVADVCVVPETNTAIIASPTTDPRGAIVAVDLSTRQVTRAFTFSNLRPQRVVCDPMRNQVVILGHPSSSGQGGGVAVLDLNAWRVTATFDFPVSFVITERDGGIALNPWTNTAYVLGNIVEDGRPLGSRIFILDLNTGLISEALPIERRANRLAVNPNIHQALVTLPAVFREDEPIEPAALLTIDLKSRAVAAVVPLSRLDDPAGPSNITLDLQTNSAIVTDQTTHRVIIVDLTKQVVAYSVRIPLFNSNAQSVAFNPITRTIVATGNFVSVFRAPYTPP